MRARYSDTTGFLSFRWVGIIPTHCPTHTPIPARITLTYIGLLHVVPRLNDGSFFELLAITAHEARRHNVQRVTSMSATCLLTIAGNIPLSTCATSVTVACCCTRLHVTRSQPIGALQSLRIPPGWLGSLNSSSTSYQHHIQLHTRKYARTHNVRPNAMERHLTHNNTPTVSWSLCLTPREENGGASATRHY
ncbi:unnamed protein product [Trypanosoma congolense IL3000]|uniref:WGS project CAEQ00000000 data, annotated contig 966 n=1 Tax=Trypanosoma congolense (strain IL3000) TaxID=1068625 RepID=F9WJY5_TRYCI|nr:unnamed protein product [Trypanosoma congolense IL3000]